MNRPAMIAGAVSLLLAIAAAGFLLFLPCAVKSVKWTSTGGEQPKVEESCSSLLESQGNGVVLFTMLPVALAALTLAFVALKSRVGAWISVALAFIYALISMASIGMFFFPSVVAMTVSASLLARRRGGPLETQPTS